MERKASGWYVVKAGCQSLECVPPFKEILIEKPTSGGMTNKLVMNEPERELIWYVTTLSFS